MFAELIDTDGYTIFVNPFAVATIEDGKNEHGQPRVALGMRNDMTQWVQGTARDAHRALRDAAYDYANAHEPSYQ